MMKENNKFIYCILVLMGIAITSMFLFPFAFKALPAYNTKQMMGALGATLFFFDTARKGKAHFDLDFLVLTIMACVVSLCGLFSVAYNQTSDYAYSNYLMSMWMWMSAGYAAYSWIRFVHGKASVPILSNYLIAVCVFQCVMALWMDHDHAIRDFVDTYIEQGQDFLKQKNVHRIYGIGASLDVAGSRFSAILVVTACMILDKECTRDWWKIPTYIAAFAVIAVIGNIVARTTTVGLVLGIGILMCKGTSFTLTEETRKLMMWMGLLTVVAMVLVTVFYNTDATFRKQIRFAFEGFFSIFEKGKWYTTSNETLKGMVVWPESTKTWLIGDGYFDSARNDPYFIGKIDGGYYMGTDIGYLRFIFYFGIFGLLSFCVLIAKAAQTCIKRFGMRHFWMFFLLAMTNYIVWLKVATDIFLVLAIYLCIGKEENEEYYKEIEVEEE